MDRFDEGLRGDLSLARERRREILRKRAEILDGVTTGAIAVEDAMVEPAVRRMHAYTFLKKMPRIGRVTARKILCELNIGETQRLSSLGSRQRARMAVLIDGAHPRGSR